MRNRGFLEKLLDGADVEWIPLGELGELVRGNGLPKSDFTQSGVPAIHYGQIYTYYGLSTNSTISFVSAETAATLKKVNKGDVIITNTSENFEDVGTPLVYFGKEQAVTGGHATIFKPITSVLGMYFAYFAQTPEFDKAKRKLAKGAKVIDVSANDMAKILIPIPCPQDPEKSIAIQAEIVRILDSFTELTAELKVRKQQYNHYRDQLLSFKEGDVQWKPLGELCTSVLAGGDVPEKCAKGQTEPSEEFPYPVYANAVGEKGLYGFSDSYRVESDAVTIAARGAKIGYHAVRDGKFTPIIRLIVLVADNTLISTDFLNYVLEMTPISGTKGGIPQLTVPAVKKITVPVPFPNDPRKSLAEQARIVAILDKFNTLTTSLSEGLPREIKLRQRQYEYYRDLLLSFPKPEEAA
ncbi:restriction endonuclease subunit S [Ruegeria sp.]|uniref:restriction endonuclease subunit S n=1 Tax=Ruegeria sp. TaxID=1879320 RepID=UPI00230FF0D7|nr:restriction endonuclease subunit S [Ruegeria sp.]MDA7966394.1 restriction endonuclease subunit S [Ruegeria sp.]